MCGTTTVERERERGKATTCEGDSHCHTLMMLDSEVCGMCTGVKGIDILLN